MIQNPYRDLDENALSRVQANIGKVDKNLLRSVHADAGLFTALVGKLIHALSNDLRNKNITHWTPENEQYLYECINARLGTDTSTPATPLSGDVAGPHTGPSNPGPTTNTSAANPPCPNSAAKPIKTVDRRPVERRGNKNIQPKTPQSHGIQPV